MSIANRESKKDKARGLKPQVEPSHYFRKEYDTKGRFISYWHQINEIILLEPNSMLEVGIGNGLVTNYLKRRDIDLTTLDIDGRLNPDHVGTVLDMPFADKSFEVVVCYELLEHLPYKDVHKALAEIHRVSSKYAVLSLPDSTRAYRLDIQIPKIGELKRLIPLPRLKAPKHRFDGEHYWEIGKTGYPLRKIMREMRSAGFEIKRTYRVFEHSFHRFFVLGRSEK
jgi:SAM-dependent methyltransferase